MDFSANFYNIENFVKVDLFETTIKIRLIFRFWETAGRIRCRTQ